MAVSVHDVAAYTLQRLGKTHTLKLQKLLYYMQGWTLVATDEPLFTEEIRAFEKGPVVYNLWSAHRSTRWFERGAVAGNADRIPDELRPILDAVLEFYERFDRFQLVDKTHEEQPWKDAWESALAHRGNRITPEAMRTFFVEQLVSEDARTPHLPPVKHTYVSQDFLDELEEDDDDEVASATWTSALARARAALAG